MTTSIVHIDVACPIGTVRIHARGQVIVAIDLPNHLSESESDPQHPLLREAANQIEQYFAGERQSFDLPLAPAGTEFQQTVWRALSTIPFGETRSYGQVAAQIGRPGSSRAVGAANGRNPIAIVIPCHRVIGSDGSLTGYGGGEPTKRWLLDHEAASAGLRLQLG